MSENGNKPLPFPASTSTPIVGQPFTLLSILVPVTAVLKCNCGAEGGDTTVTIVQSVSAPCPGCQRVWNVALNPTTMKLEFAMALPDPAQVPS